MMEVKLTGQKVNEQIGETKIKQYTPKNKKVRILGTASTLPMVNWNEKDYDYWACAPVITQPCVKDHLKQIGLMFEIHPMEYWINIIERLNSVKIPCYMQKANPHIKESMTYPLEEVKSLVWNSRIKRYFTSTISYMIALAIYMKYEYIECWGVHMAAEEEYGDQRQACETWLGVAEGKGIKTYIPDQSQILRNPHLYGYEQINNASVYARHRKKGMINGLNKINVDIRNKQFELKELEKARDMQEGAIKEDEHFDRHYR
jgi:hypothetical protein